ncbi:MAG: PD-(D/E)XK nuclease family protein [Planctomycetaceae bacterium]|nr:PD-(D/E)XK nuclease family protein [Planctomycetaceae bacterium]
MKPVFLNWTEPPLHTAADYFVKQFTRDGVLNMRNVTVAVTGKQAGLRLLELLAECAEQMDIPAWYPPEVITFGQLPEQFYTRRKEFADDLTQAFVWVKALEECFADSGNFLPKMPEDLEKRLRLGQAFAELHKELTAEDLDFNAVAVHCEKYNIGSEVPRWKFLAGVQKRYHRLMDDSLNLWDRNSAILFAVNRQEEKEYSEFVRGFRQNGQRFFLAGVADMNKVQKDIVSKFEEFITPLIFAPEEYKHKFDNFGGLIPKEWVDEPVKIDDAQIAVAEDFCGQADEVLRKIAAQQGQYSADEIAAGLPDEKLLPVIEQRFERAGLTTEYVKGLPIQRTSVYRLVELLPELAVEPLAAQQVPYRAFAEFLRHPDVQSSAVLTQLDNYYTVHLPRNVNGTWAEDVLNDKSQTETQEQLDAAWRSIQELFFAAASNTVNNAERLNIILNQFYGGEQSRFTNEALKHIRKAMNTVADIPKQVLPDVPFRNFVRLILRELGGTFIPPFDKPEAIELVGWLDLPMNDASVAVITGMNDGTVPSYVNEDIFLPDELRQHLNITDNRKRIARDVYNLSLILNSRQKENVLLIAGRRTEDGSAQLPSRLFFAADDVTVCERVKRFFGEQPKRESVRFANEEIKERQFGFTVPAAENIGSEITKLSVSDFKNYKICPYRFYLKRLKYLQHLNDTDAEMGANTFGSLIHKVLELFGKSGYRNADDAAVIERFVLNEFRTLAEQQYGSAPAAVQLQFGMAEQRLKAFAVKQAERRNEGWTIVDTEIHFGEKDGIKILDGTLPIYLTGRIDRIDRHKNGEYAVLDYKTGDSKAAPEEVHRKGRKGAKEWVDFQLPLYDFLVRHCGRESVIPANAEIQLGYFVLPKDDTGGIITVKWSPDEIKAAAEECRDIAQKIRRNEFPLAEDPPKYDDFPEICLP